MSFTSFLDIARAGRSGENEPFWLSTYRANALERFSSLGIPSRREEGWQFTDLRPLTNALPEASKELHLAPGSLDAHFLAEPSYRLVFVNGVFQAALSSFDDQPAGVALGPIGKAAPELLRQAFDPSDMTGSQAFAAFNAAAFTDGFVLSLDAGVALDRPLEIVHVLGDGGTAQTRNLIQIGAGAAATLVETYIGFGLGWTNTVTKVELGDGAALRHIKVSGEPDTANSTSILRAHLAQDAAYDVFIATLGSRLSRQDLQVTMAGERARTGIFGVYLLKGEQEATLAPLVDHQAPNCSTNEVLKGVLEDRAHGVFLGTVMVREGADGTDAHQLNRNLLLSSEARVDTKPELTIYADDVKCSHGATVGDLDEAAFFYLLSRGIEPESARKMLIGAFVQDVVDGAGLTGALADHVNKYITKQLGGTE